MFHVVLRRAGARWDPGVALGGRAGWEEHAAFMDNLVDDGFVVLGGPLSDGDRVVHAVEAEDEEVVRAPLARDPWPPSHLTIESIAAWTIRLDARERA